MNELKGFLLPSSEVISKINLLENKLKKVKNAKVKRESQLVSRGIVGPYDREDFAYLLNKDTCEDLFNDEMMEVDSRYSLLLSIEANVKKNLSEYRFILDIRDSLVDINIKYSFCF
jgi:CTP:phosphocholine cytidylyltransferase-like protein